MPAQVYADPVQGGPQAGRLALRGGGLRDVALLDVYHGVIAVGVGSAVVVPGLRCGHPRSRAGVRARTGVVGACRLRSGHLKALPVSRLLLSVAFRSRPLHGCALAAGDLSRFATLARTPPGGCPAG